MALINVSNRGGDFLPVLKYDARAGRVFRVDRDENGITSVDITKSFKAVVDFASAEVGWIYFAAGGAPDFRMVSLGAPMPDRPNDTYKQGVRLTLKLAPGCGGDVRELATTSAATLRGINDLHDEYLRLASTQAGKLPIVTLTDTLPIESRGQGQKSTNYQPVFAISGWAPRPADMPAGAGSRAAANGHAAAAQPTARPASTGSTRVDPPKSAPPADDALDDFG